MTCRRWQRKTWENTIQKWFYCYGRRQGRLNEKCGKSVNKLIRSVSS